MTQRPPITVTGADQRCRDEDLVELQAEIGFLFSLSRLGNRYPEWDWIRRTARKVQFAALHVCGREARRQLLQGELDLEAFQRVQINGTVSELDLRQACAVYPDVTFITQHTEPNNALADIQDLGGQHHILVDASGGKGLVPRYWEDPSLQGRGIQKPIGYAGGLSPANLLIHMPAILNAARRGWWIDMESGVRNAEDWFCIHRARRVTAQFGLFMARVREAEVTRRPLRTHMLDMTYTEQQDAVASALTQLLSNLPTTTQEHKQVAKFALWANEQLALHRKIPD